LPFPWSPKYPYLPSAPSLTGEIVNNVQHFLAGLNEVDVKALARNVNNLLLTLNDKASQLPVAAIAQDLQSVLKSTSATVNHVNDAVTAPGIRQSIDNVAVMTTRLRQLTERGELDRTVSELDKTVARLDGVVGDNEYDLRIIVEDLRATAHNLRTLSAALKSHPVGALIASPPEEVQLPKNPP